MAGEEVLDLRSLSTLCGDYSVHIMEKLEHLPPGARLRVVVPADSRELLREAVGALTSAGLARKVDEGEEGDAYYVVLEKAG